MYVPSPQRAVPARQNISSNAQSGFFGTSADTTPTKERISQLAQMNNGRSRSVDQTANMESLEALPIRPPRRDKKSDKEKEREQVATNYRRTNQTGFFGGFGNSSSKAADGLGKASRGLLQKLTRSGSSTDKAGHAGIEEEFEPRLLKLPLIQQTRETRIAKSYDHCRDKTEFWMPALPWRCIEYVDICYPTSSSDKV